VFIIWRLARLLCRVADTAAESCDGQYKESLNLSFSQGISFLIGRDHLSRRADRVWFVEHYISQCDGQVAYGGAVNYIAIVENRGNSRSRLIDQDVVVVCVVVNDAEAKTVPVDLFPFTEKPFD